jgi:hypothetical protein
MLNSTPQPENFCRNLLFFAATQKPTPQRKTPCRNFSFFAAT